MYSAPDVVVMDLDLYAKMDGMKSHEGYVIVLTFLSFMFES
jgi:hypothetical protein